MRKGISPIVAVVLLIAIAVIAAVGLYFWVGGLATKQPTPSTPIVIGAQKTACTLQDATGGDSIAVLIQNLDASTAYTNSTHAPYIIGDNGKRLVSEATWDLSIAASSQEAVIFTNDSASSVADSANLTSGRTYVIISAAGAGQAQVVC